MTVAYHAAWDCAVLASGAGFSISVDDSGAGATITVPSGMYSHVNFSSVLSTVSVFATKLQTDLNAAAGLNGTYTVSFSTTTLKYTISCTENFSILSGNDDSLALLGITSTPTASATSYTSDAAVYYSRLARIGARTADTGNYEPDGFAEDSDGDGATYFGVALKNPPTFRDWTQVYELLADVYTDSAAVADPFTWERFVKHVRNVYPFAVVDSNTSDTTVHYMRAQSARWAPQPTVADYHAEWDIRFQTRYVGTV